AMADFTGASCISGLKICVDAAIYLKSDDSVSRCTELATGFGHLREFGPMGKSPEGDRTTQ
ncbi:MAG: hypothetical protein AAFQ40_00005, partial [Cyanobacteria bacterium J06623_5]